MYIYIHVCVLVFLSSTRLYIEGFSPRSRSKKSQWEVIECDILERAGQLHRRSG